MDDSKVPFVGAEGIAAIASVFSGNVTPSLFCCCVFSAIALRCLVELRGGTVPKTGTGIDLVEALLSLTGAVIFFAMRVGDPGVINWSMAK